MVLSFGQWLKHRFRGHRTLSTFLAIPIVASTLLGIAQKWLELGFYSLASTALQLACILFVIGVGAFRKSKEWSPPDEAIEESKSAYKAVRQFNKCWMALWISWAALYCVLLIKEVCKVAIDIPELVMSILDCTEHLGSESASAACFLLFFVLAFRTVNVGDSKGMGIPWSIAIVYVIVSIIVYGFFKFVEFEAGLTVFEIVSAFLGGLILMLFIGRLDDRIILAPFWCIGIMYAYPLLQILFGFTKIQSDSLPDDFSGFLSNMKVVLLSLALPFKLLLFVLVRWMLEEGILFWYMKVGRNLMDHGFEKVSDLLTHEFDGAGYPLDEDTLMAQPDEFDTPESLFD